MTGTFDVCEERCDQCLFSPDKVVGGERRAEILQSCARADIHFVCHKFSIAAAEGQDVSDQTCCRGFYDMGRPSQLMRIAEGLGVLRFVPIPKDADVVAAEAVGEGHGQEPVS